MSEPAVQVIDVLACIPPSKGTFARSLADAMERVDVGQRQLGLLAGVDHSVISRLVRGHQEPSLATAIRIARAIGEWDAGRHGR